MKKVVFNRFGPPAKVAECVTVDNVAAPQDWEATVDIISAPINPSDVSVLRGQYGKLPSSFPATTGLEAAGRIVAVGSMVKNLAVGDNVLVVANDNWVQRRNVSAKQLCKLPDWIDIAQASMLKVNAASALMLLRRFPDLMEGDHIIQSAPLSSVGRMVIAFAKSKGIKTVNIVRRETAIEEVEALGGDYAIMQSPELASAVAEATDYAPISVAFDAVAGETVSQLADCLETNGTIINYGMLSGEPCVLRADHTIFKNIKLEGFWLLKHLSRIKQSERDSLFAELFDLVKASGAKSEVAGSFPLEQISDAIAASEAEGRLGKVILTPNGPLDEVAVASVAKGELVDS